MDGKRVIFEAIGTQWDIQVVEPVADVDWQELLDQVHARIDAFDAVYSRFRTDSLVTKMSQSAGKYELPDDGFNLVQCYERLYKATDGRITPLIGQTMTDAGYDARYSLQKKNLLAPPRWEDILTYDEHSITLLQPALLDFGAAGKGYLVDIIGDLLAAAGHQSYLINAGGDMLRRSTGQAALHVGLENPFDTSEAIGIAALGNQSLCASAGSKRQWAGLHHIIDPISLTSPEAVVATWVMADSTMLADGLASALFFTDPEALRLSFDFRYALLDADGGLRYGTDFPITLFEEA